MGVPVALPHLLNVKGAPVTPNITLPNNGGFTIAVSPTNVTVTRGTGPGNVDVYVEFWHTIDAVTPPGALTGLLPFILSSSAGSVNPAILQSTNANGSSITICQAVYQTAVADNVNLARANAASTAQVFGLVAQPSIASGASGSILTAGPLVATTAQWDAVVTGEVGGLTPGAQYWLDPTTAGNLTATAPTTPGQFDTYVGQAKNPTTLLIDIAQAIGA